MSIAFMSVTALIMISIPDTLVGAFLKGDDPAAPRVAALAVSFLFVAALFQIFDGAQVVGAGMLRGLQDTTIPMIYAALGYWGVGLSVGYGLAFGLGWGGVGIWIGLATGLFSVSLMMIVRWLRRERLGLTASPDKAAILS
jgi:MATE family multidrug resistance protein